jgi:biopolymer transport protein ExbB/TolQ
MRQIFVFRGAIIMISPVNSDKPIKPSTDHSDRSQANRETAEAPSLPSSQQNTQKTQSTASTVEVDQARRVFDIENSNLQPLENAPQTPEQARSLLDGILAQLSASPETAAEAQASNSSADTIAGILRGAPA